MDYDQDNDVSEDAPPKGKHVHDTVDEENGTVQPEDAIMDDVQTNLNGIRESKVDDLLGRDYLVVMGEDTLAYDLGTTIEEG